MTERKTLKIRVPSAEDAAPALKKKTASDRQKERKCAEVKADLDKKRARMQAGETALGSEVLALELSWQLGC